MRNPPLDQHYSVSRMDHKEVTASLQWRHNGRDGVSNHYPHHYLLIRLFRRRSTKTSNFRVTRLWAGNSPVTGEFPAQKASNAENVSIWWRHVCSVRSDGSFSYMKMNQPVINVRLSVYNFQISTQCLSLTVIWPPPSTIKAFLGSIWLQKMAHSMDLRW